MLPTGTVARSRSVTRANDPAGIMTAANAPGLVNMDHVGVE
jgi:hypothetical protein